MLATTVAAIQGQTCAPGTPKTASTMVFGTAAPIATAAIAVALSARDFTQPFQVAWSAALTSMRAKTVMSTENSGSDVTEHVQEAR
jgi:hypothetical protein